MIYNLSIACVDGSTIFGMISSDKVALLRFLLRFDHEGSCVSLVKHHVMNATFEDIDNPDKVYTELVA